LIRFKWESTECQACHGDPHEGQLVQAGCQSCHSVQGWARVTFDHNRQSRFKLEGAHARLPCAACHGKTIVRFKPLPIACEGCHGSKTGRSS
jgi:RecJ-like exonuclease